VGIFHWNTNEANTLWLTGWIPTMEDQYLSACLGLFLMAIVVRGLGGINIFFTTWLRAKDYNRLPIVVSKNKKVTSSNNNNNNTKIPWSPSFEWITDTLSSVLTTLEYFLMFLLTMIVMTGNGQYFISILLGIFIGEMIFGRLR
ncbi:Ctr copper transporter, partial [Circinella umbellata]